MTTRRTLLTALATLTLATPTLAQNYTQPTTPDGQPDISGIWTSFDTTPFEVETPEVLADLKALAYWFPGVDGVEGGPGVGPSGDFSQAEPHAAQNQRRRSMVVDPPTGQVPILDSARAVRDDNLNRLADHWVHNTPWERCITRGVPGNMFPTYNTGHLILQIPGYVIISSEMIHVSRIIPIDDTPRPPGAIRQWNGNSRGHWEGDTLVVETVGYNTKGTVGTNVATRRIRGIPQSEAMKVIERFIRVDEDNMTYQVTVEDPNAFEHAWTVELPMNYSPDYRILEYTCHEGNYGLENTLRGGRAEDKARGQ